MIKTGGSKFDPNDRLKYFIAANLHRQQHGARMHSNILVAVNEINTDEDFIVLERWFDAGQNILIDSGIFMLAMDHARKYNVSHDEGLAMPPDEIDGFEKLWDKYIRLLKRFGERCWGYIELDQGGRENKIKTREKLEAIGLHPIPVYHPLLDGWDYFDYLAQNYDRICFGNVVQAGINTRKRLVATAWERKQQYPELWIHLLGLTANEWLNAYPIDSCDSSTWLSTIRWPIGITERADGKDIGRVSYQFQPQIGVEQDSEVSSKKACKMSAYIQRMQNQNWKDAVEWWYQ